MQRSQCGDFELSFRIASVLLSDQGMEDLGNRLHRFLGFYDSIVNIFGDFGK
ncbi:MAG: hypothetical protein IID44_11490 [Planctomycetes bacterium]|nr:hypothetical protein [Planctomycetota bacterium]